MAINNYGYPYPANFASPTYFQQQTTNSAYQTPQMPQMPQMPSSQNTASNGLIWVQGETGAKSFIVAPGATVMLMDSEAQQFFIKTADASGMPLPLRVFEYKEKITQNAQSAEGAEYITRKEFDRRLAEIQAASARKEEVNGNE